MSERKASEGKSLRGIEGERAEDRASETCTYQRDQPQIAPLLQQEWSETQVGRSEGGAKSKISYYNERFDVTVLAASSTVVAENIYTVEVDNAKVWVVIRAMEKKKSEEPKRSNWCGLMRGICTLCDRFRSARWTHDRWEPRCAAW